MNKREAHVVALRIARNAVSRLQPPAGLDDKDSGRIERELARITNALVARVARLEGVEKKSSPYKMSPLWQDDSPPAIHVIAPERSGGTE